GAGVALDRVEEAPLARGAAGPADVGEHVDVAALDEVGVVAGELSELARARPRSGVLGVILPVRSLGEDDGKGALGLLAGLGVGGVVDVRPQDRAVAHLDGEVLALANFVARSFGLPGEGCWRVDGRGGE